MPIKPISIAIVDDSALFRKILKNYLSEQRNIQVAIQVPDMPELVHHLKGMPVDIVLIDLEIPGMNGAEAVKTIRSEFPAIKILAMSRSTNIDVISDLLDLGIHGYITKSDEPEELLQAIQAISDGRIYRNRLFTEALYWNKQNSIRTYINESSYTLSEREKKILQLIWEEKSNKEIADDLFLGVRSVEKIRQDIKEKIGAKSTVGLLKYAIKKKIVGVNSLVLR